MDEFREASANGLVRTRVRVRKPWAASKRERGLILLVAATLTFNVWGFGGTSWWLPTVVTFYAGLASLLWILVPLPERWDVDAEANTTTPKANLQRLLKFPVLWCGLLLLAYMSISGLNPSAQMWTDGQRLWFTPLTHIRWLPSGLNTPFEDMNAWRATMLYAGPFFFLCSIRAAVHHRKSLNVLLYTIVINAVPLAVYGGWFRSQDYYAGVTKIYGLVHFQRFDFPYVWTIRPFGPILGPNIAASFLYLAIATNLALLTPLFAKDFWIDHRRTALAGFLCICLTVLTAGLVFTASKAGLLIVCGIFAVWGAVLFVRIVRSTPSRTVGIVAGVAVLAAGVIGAFYVYKNLERILPRFSAMRVADFELVAESSSAKARMAFNDRTWAMFLDSPVTGHGGGTYRYGIRRYLNQDPRFDTEQGGWRIGRLTYAHNDYLQFLAEYGVAGAVLAALLLLAVAVGALRNGVLRHPAGIMLAAGVAGMMVHAAVDFPTAVALNLMVISTLTARIVTVDAVRGAEPRT